MPARSLKDQIDALTTRRVAEAKVGGAPSPDVETLALFESVAFNLLVKPKAVLFVEHLARNGLLKTVEEEVTLLEEMLKTVSDTGNPTYTVRSTKDLEKAKNALLSIEGLDKISTSSGAFSRFDSAISTFLDKQLGKSVRKKGRTELLRPGDEAGTDLSLQFSELKELHADLLERLYALAVGVENFLSSPLSTIIGLTTVARARSEIEEIIEGLADDPTSKSARDMAIRLIGSRAAMKVAGSLPDIYAAVIDTDSSLPTGHVLHGRSPATKIRVTSAAGPFVLPAAATFGMSIGGPIASQGFPQTTSDLANQAYVISSAVTFPVTIPEYTYLFVSITRSDASVESYLVTLNGTAAPVSMSKAAILAALNAELGPDAVAEEFVQAGTNRLIIYAIAGGAPTRDRISIDPVLQVPSSSTMGIPATYTRSAHALLGFQSGQTGTRGSTSVSTIIDAMNVRVGALGTATDNLDGTFSFETVEDEVGTALAVVAPAVLGIAGIHRAKSNVVQLYGEVFGASVDPVDAIPLVDISDVLEGPTGSAAIASFLGGSIVLDTELELFDGPILVTSSLVTAMRSLDAEIESFLKTWLKGRFKEGLSAIEPVIAALSGNPTPTQRASASRLLAELKTRIVELQAVLEDPTTLLPKGSATEERGVVDGVVASLLERKFDRALSMFLKCQIQEVLALEHDTASFGGALMKALSEVAQNDAVFPNTAIDEDDGIKGSQERTGL